jgi:hypothetical protein
MLATVQCSQESSFLGSFTGGEEGKAESRHSGTLESAQRPGLLEKL